MSHSTVIIGGGASGLTAAIAAARSGASVTVLEHNDRPGRKLLASGNGKCNLTNLQLRPEQYDTDNPELVASCLERFSVHDTLGFFGELGLVTKDRDGWVYPVTDQASSVLQVLLREAQQLPVKIKTRESVCSLSRTADADRGQPWEIRTEGWTYLSDSVVLACGSPASAVQGSSGLALKLGAELGLGCADWHAALVPLRIKGKLPAKWTPCRVHASASLVIDGVPSGTDTGELQLTENGISGIPVFQISRKAVEAADAGKKTEIVISFWPQTEEKELSRMLAERRNRPSCHSWGDALTGMLPDRIIAMLCANTAADADASSMARLITHFAVPAGGASSLRQAQVCKGGLLLAEFDENLGHREQRGLFAAGEALNVTGPCGGYNLQWAWTSGMIAGKNAAAFCG